MVLRNKDGTIYKLNSPNPTMKEQVSWVDFQIHNMNWQAEILEDTSELNAIKTDFQVNNNFISELDQAAAEVRTSIKSAEKPVVEKPIEKPISFNSEQKLNIPKILMHCLPAYFEQKIDPIYGETVQILKYKSPFTLEAVIVDQNDLNFKFWTEKNELTQFIESSSVIFPKSGHRRWWKVQDKQEKTGGWIFDCYPSDFQPHFET